MAGSIGILAHYLAEHASLQQRLREQPDLLGAAIDEILRIHAPLIANRRVLRHDAQVGGKALAAGERVTLMWASANRDESVFGEPDEFRLDRAHGAAHRDGSAAGRHPPHLRGCRASAGAGAVSGQRFLVIAPARRARLKLRARASRVCRRCGPG
jgi:cytochrome P450